MPGQKRAAVKSFFSKLVLKNTFIEVDREQEEEHQHQWAPKVDRRHWWQFRKNDGNAPKSRSFGFESEHSTHCSSCDGESIISSASLTRRSSVFSDTSECASWLGDDESEVDQSEFANGIQEIDNENLRTLSLIEDDMWDPAEQHDNFRTLSFPLDDDEDAMAQTNADQQPHDALMSWYACNNAAAPNPVWYVPVVVPAVSPVATAADENKAMDLDAKANELEEQAKQLQAQVAAIKRQAQEARAAMKPPAPNGPPGNWSSSASSASSSPPPGTFFTSAKNSPAGKASSSSSQASSKKSERWSDVSDEEESDASSSCNESQKTTVMLRNCPNDIRRDDICDILDEQGLTGKYDFVYFPMDFLREAGLGYVFVNFTSHESAVKAFAVMQGYSDWPIPTLKECRVSWGEPIQGLQQNIERYQNSPVMHEDVPEEYKPIILESGLRVPFPPPTKRIKAPRMKRTKPHGNPAAKTETA